MQTQQNLDCESNEKLTDLRKMHESQSMQNEANICMTESKCLEAFFVIHTWAALMQWRKQCTLHLELTLNPMLVVCNNISEVDFFLPFFVFTNMDG